MPEVHYLALGHLARDLASTGWRVGGTVAFAALTARALGYTPGILSAHTADLTDPALADVPVHRVDTPQCTTFENVTTPAGRVQYLRAHAVPLTPDQTPLAWLRAPVVHLGPIAHELSAEFFNAFPGAFIGLTPQGFLRQWDDAGRVSPREWASAAHYLPQVSAVVASIEDFGGDWAVPERWAKHAPVLVVTEGRQGCTVFVRGQGARQLAAPPQTEVDATGAGDIFASAFFIHLYETNDPLTSAQFATQLAALSVTRAGLAGAPTPDEVGLARVRVALG